MRFFLSTIKGFISPHLAKRLISMGHNVDAVGTEKSVPGVRLVTPFDLNCNQYDYCVHLAATTSISQDFNPKLFFNNIIYANQIMKNNVRTIYASSTSAYELNNVYAYTKAFAEHLGRLHGNALGLRFFNCYGAGNNKGIVKRTIDCILKGETLELTGGDLIRDFIYIDDVVDIIVDYLDFPAPIMDVGTGIGTRIKDVVSEIRDVMKEIGVLPEGKPFIIKNVEKDHSTEQLVSIAKSSPMKSYMPLREGLRETIEETLKSR